MSNFARNLDSPQDQDAGAGDVKKSQDGAKQTSVKKEVPPPVKPRPATARGQRTPTSGFTQASKFATSRSSDFSQQESRRTATKNSLSSTQLQSIPSTSRSVVDNNSADTYADGGSNEELKIGEQGRVLLNTFIREQAENTPLDVPSTSKSCVDSPSADTYVDGISNEEHKIGEQGRVLLNVFIRGQAENTPQEPIIREVCQADQDEVRRVGFSDDSLSDIATTLRRIGDDISHNVELNNFIEQVPVQSTKEIFMKVCLQIFQDGDLNWGRVVALFYFAYRLIVRTLSRGLDCVPWVQDMLSWAGDVLVKHVARWILSRGGWNMIKEYFGPSNQTWLLLIIATITFGSWAYFRKR